jgi:hypothetical protein
LTLGSPPESGVDCENPVEFTKVAAAAASRQTIASEDFDISTLFRAKENPAM